MTTPGDNYVDKHRLLPIRDIGATSISGRIAVGSGHSLNHTDLEDVLAFFGFWEEGGHG